MPPSEITPADVVRAGTLAETWTTGDPVNGHFIAVNDGDVELEVVNDSGTAQTIEVTPNPNITSDGLTVNDLVLDVPSGATAGAPAHYGAFKPNTFRQDTSGRMEFTPSTTLLIRAYRRPQERS